MLVVGEIRTCMLQNSSSLPRAVVADLLRILPGEQARTSEHPIAHALSPARITGVDCQLATASGSRCRGVGTVSARAVVSGGRALQGSVHTRIERGRTSIRQPWSHYLGLPGVVQTTGRFAEPDVAAGYLDKAVPKGTLDLGAVGERLISSVQLSPRLDRVVALRTPRTRLRWVAMLGAVTADGPVAEFTIVDDVVRNLTISSPSDDLADVIGFCENLALHDWILSTLLRIVERSMLGSSADEALIDRLKPAMDHLLHLWMPGAHVSRSLLPVWESLESRAGFSRQWAATVTRIRDQIALHTLIGLRSR